MKVLPATYVDRSDPVVCADQRRSEALRELVALSLAHFPNLQAGDDKH